SPPASMGSVTPVWTPSRLVSSSGGVPRLVAGRTRSALRPPTTISRLSDSKAAGPVECAVPAALLERTNLVRNSLAVLPRRRLAPAAAAQGREIPAAGEHDGPKGSRAE